MFQLLEHLYCSFCSEPLCCLSWYCFLLACWYAAWRRARGCRKLCYTGNILQYEFAFWISLSWKPAFVLFERCFVYILSNARRNTLICSVFYHSLRQRRCELSISWFHLNKAIRQFVGTNGLHDCIYFIFACFVISLGLCCANVCEN